MPAIPGDGMTVTIASMKQITALTLSPNAGQSIVGALTSLPANQATTYVYRAASTTWYPITSVATNAPVTGGGSAITSGTAQTTTSGTAIDFTGIPSWVKRITVMFNGVSTSGSSNIQLQLGSGSVQTTGYTGSGLQVANGSAANVANSTTGILTSGATAATAVLSGSMTFSLLGSNTWVAQGVFGRSDSASSCFGGGAVTLSGALDRVRITTGNGTDTFDAGSVNIMYE
jgi:hypothetical protein